MRVIVMRNTIAVLAGALALAASCRSARPDAQPEVRDSAPPSEQRATLADASFMQGMIAHHAQALAMTRLVRARTTAADVRTLAERIDRSQRDEIELMARWLVARGQSVPDTTHLAAGHDDPAHRMPGMLTPGQMQSLADARGPAFDRIFLELMIQHHEGALTMVQQLLSRAGGGQDPEAYRFASDVDADQRAEIARMRSLLAARGSPNGAA